MFSTACWFLQSNKHSGDVFFLCRLLWLWLLRPIAVLDVGGELADALVLLPLAEMGVDRERGFDVCVT